MICHPACVPARSPLLETVEAVEATQLPGQMAPRQHAKDAAFPLRSRGERAFSALNEAPRRSAYVSYGSKIGQGDCRQFSTVFDSFRQCSTVGSFRQLRQCSTVLDSSTVRSTASTVSTVRAQPCKLHAATLELSVLTFTLALEPGA